MIVSKYFVGGGLWRLLNIIYLHKNKCALTSKGDNSVEKLHTPTSDFSIFDYLHYRLRVTFIGN
jgi:hypothetical protein